MGMWAPESDASLVNAVAKLIDESLKMSQRVLRECGVKEPQVAIVGRNMCSKVLGRWAQFVFDVARGDETFDYRAADRYLQRAFGTVPPPGLPWTRPVRQPTRRKR